MSKNEITKYRLAQAIKTCMRTTSVDDITVKSIVETCGVTRQTFYRNFLDKYDLINWYFDKLLLKSFEHMGSGRTVSEGLTRKFEYIQEERVFFAAAFRCDDHNSLKDHDFELILKFYTDLIEKKSGAPMDPELKFLLEFYCRASIDMTVQWVLTGMHKTPAQLSKLLVSAMPARLSELFLKLGLLEKLSDHK